MLKMKGCIICYARNLEVDMIQWARSPCKKLVVHCRCYNKDHGDFKKHAKKQNCCLNPAHSNMILTEERKRKFLLSKKHFT